MDLNDKKQTALETLRGLVKLSEYDEERAHILADQVLCDLLRDLGYDDDVAEFERIDKWYA